MATNNDDSNLTCKFHCASAKFEQTSQHSSGIRGANFDLGPKLRDEILSSVTFYTWLHILIVRSFIDKFQQFQKQKSVIKLKLTNLYSAIKIQRRLTAGRGLVS